MNWFKQVASDLKGNPSSKRHVVLASAAVLCLVSLALGSACAVWVYRAGDLGAGAVGALTFALGILASLAGISQRTKDGALVPPATGDKSTNAPGAASLGEDALTAGSDKIGSVFASSPDRGKI